MQNMFLRVALLLVLALAFLITTAYDLIRLTRSESPAKASTHLR